MEPNFITGAILPRVSNPGVHPPVNDAKHWGGMLGSIFSQNGTTQNIPNRAESVLQRRGKKVGHCADTYRTARASSVCFAPLNRGANSGAGYSFKLGCAEGPIRAAIGCRAAADIATC